MKKPVVVSAFVVAAVAASGIASCSSTSCDVTNGYTVCDGFTTGYPYNYTAVVPYDAYTVETFSGSPEYFLVASGASAFGGDASVVAEARTSGDAGLANLPELMDAARHGAGFINSGIRLAFTPIRVLLQTEPIKSSDTLTYGPVAQKSATYVFVLKRLGGSPEQFGWALRAKPNGTAGSFALVAGGLLTPGNTPRRGRGVLTIDFDRLAVADPSTSGAGQLRLGFVTDASTKLLHYALDGYSPDTTVSPPLTAIAVAYHTDAGNTDRVVTRTNLSQTATSAAETVVVKLKWLKTVGARADGAATGGDVPEGRALFVSTCVPASLDKADASTSAELCAVDGSSCTPLPGTGTGTITCPEGLQTPDRPSADPNADDAPAGLPQLPEIPRAVIDGTAGG
jgi:hypothetical protein